MAKKVAHHLAAASKTSGGSIYPGDSGETFWSELYYQDQVTFISCSVKLNQSNSNILSCLSKNNATIYATFISFYVGYFPENCQFLYTIPLNENDGLTKFDQLKLGFTLNWHPPINSMIDAIHICAKTAGFTKFFEWESSNVINGVKVMTTYGVIRHFHFEFDFLACLHDKRYRQLIFTFYVAAVVIIVLDITLLILVLLLIGRFLFAPLCVLSFLAYNLFKLIKPIDVVERFLQNQKALSPSRYTYNEIITITSNFKEKLGQGGFGSVYKGRIPGNILVAVKMLGKSMGDGEDFINEVSTIGMIHHVNVVQLVGFCVDGSYRALVYEYMANGSLDKYIFNSNKANRFLNIEKLLEIAKSVAKGLHYLHQGCNMGILHFDIKPHNILLDHKFTPKISDFGLAKLHPKGHSLVSISAARGTIGYIAPELISRSFGTISHKSDVYSFGMLLMDMAGGRRHANLKADDSSQVYYPSWIYDKLQKMEMSKNFDISEIDDLERKLCKVGLSCIQTRPIDRPSMINVLEMLEADVDSLQMPPKPFFSSSDPVSSIYFSMDYSESELSISL
ncbi:rust resistance kinase Lr10-like isoform X2 [Dendrobium catenatum]|uniref:rust resistance kinase Lr10-like isoform X2 n=1 Tax=Dendrobium catenatum TaxID=906689 RepID=UPI0009F42ECA|nr:rust resistance kinase Lr10-like isoform X2 [Dendrobium catenatum]